jgi:hypothetical protein
VAKRLKPSMVLIRGGRGFDRREQSAEFLPVATDGIGDLAWPHLFLMPLPDRKEVVSAEDDEQQVVRQPDATSVVLGEPSRLLPLPDRK